MRDGPRGGMASVAFGAAVVIPPCAVGALLASTLPFATRLATAGAVVAAICAFAVWVRRPEVVVAGFLFALPLLERREIGAGLEPGEFVTLILVALGSLSLFVARRPRIDPRMRLVLFTLIGLAIVGGTSAAVNGVLDGETFAALVLKPVSWAIVMYLVIFYFDSSRKLRGLLLSLIAGGAAVAVAAVVQYATGHTPPAGAEGTPRADGTFENLNQLGAFMALMALPTLTYALSSKHGLLKPLLFGAFVLQLAALLLSGTLGSLLGLLVAALISVRLWSARPAIGIALSALPLLTLASLAFFAPAQGNRIYLVQDRAQDRFGTYAAGYELAKDNFWLGTGSIDVAVEQIKTNPEYHFTRFGEVTVQPHNVFLEAQVVSGVLGLSLMILLAWFLLRILLASRPFVEDTDYIVRWGIFLGCIAFLVQNATNSSLLHARLGMVFFALVTIAARLREVPSGANESVVAAHGGASDELRPATAG